MQIIDMTPRHDPRAPSDDGTGGATIYDLASFARTITDENADFGHTLAPGVASDSPAEPAPAVFMVAALAFASDTVKGAREIDLAGDGLAFAEAKNLAGGVFEEVAGAVDGGDVVVAMAVAVAVLVEPADTAFDALGGAVSDDLRPVRPRPAAAPVAAGRAALNCLAAAARRMADRAANENIDTHGPRAA